MEENMGIFDAFTKKQLQRVKLVDMITNWYRQNENIVDNKKYLPFLNSLEDEINKHSFKKNINLCWKSNPFPLYL